MSVLKKQKQFYSGKKKKHTLSVQVLIDLASLEILCTAYGEGKQQDFGLFKRSELEVAESVEILADKGYQGIARFHPRSFIPFKKPRGGTLSQTQKAYNRELAKARIKIEHVFAKLKVFRILSERYRNRRQRFGLRFNLIASLYNLELAQLQA